uniref:leucine-rich repeat and coiled-coil domain-containing protein 1-like isoform X2 n=1 Tax=Styela clava TaxID=7725 RepID=UPI00193A623B|nr:leucine-rich repeat and coiled-coil domain-containing protein 1-like isoform X2 [Styela clava]
MSLSSQVCAIKANISAFHSLCLHEDVTSINVHSNSIRDFSGLQNLRKLKDLDVSSNLIQSLSGLQSLSSLCVLNLACNHISDLQGLRTLVNLTSINLSYNKIKTLRGFSEMNGPGYKLQSIELHGNQISNISDVTPHLRGILPLRHLILSFDDQHDNPVCKEKDYRSQILNLLPQLSSLDKLDRNNLPMLQTPDNIMEMLELDLSLGDVEFTSDPLSSSQSQSSPDKSTIKMKTPNIDAVLCKVKSRPQNGCAAKDEDSIESIISSMVCNKPTSEENPTLTPEKDVQVDQEARLKYLEDQLAHLVAARQEKSTKTQKEQVTTESQSGNNIISTEASSSSPQQKIIRPVKRFQQHGLGARQKLSSEKKTQSKVPLRKQSGESKSARLVTRHVGPEEKETYLNLVKELENERERRWKSEQAAKRLAQLVRDMNSDKIEGKSLQDMAAQTAERLKQALLKERENTDEMKNEVLEYKEKLAEMSDEMASCKKTIEEQQQSLNMMETNLAKVSSDRSKISATQAKKMHEYEMKVSASMREVEIQKSLNSKLEHRIQELQEILIKREQEHRKETENMFTADSLEFRNAVSHEVNREEKRHREEIKSLQQCIVTLRNQYTELEDEFRQALHIEANRYEKADAQYTQCSGELERIQVAYRRTKEKEEKSRSIITELTAVAKEQKIKIMELSKSKHEILQQYKERILNLEITAEEGRKKGVQLELVKQEKSRLISQLAAVQSVVDGLRDERKLWGHELAQQGASLAQDRGRLESKIESLMQEILSMRKQNERDLDALKIKTKIVDDQTDTIHNMKEALVEKDQEMSRIQQESLDLQKKLEQDIEDALHDNASLSERNNILEDRKKELKEQLLDSEKEFDNLKQVHSKLVKKWAEKGQVLSQVELQVRQMKETFDKKELKLIKERDEAISAKHLLTERMERVDGAFREQLETANCSHEEEMRRMKKNHDNELEVMKRKVHSVEEEMREVLRDADRQKKNMEAKLKRITSAFTELQEGFAD